MDNGRAPPPARKIMVVVDPSRESAAAIQYALSHAVLEQDELILVHIENTTTSWKNTFSSFLRLPSSLSSSPSMSFYAGGSTPVPESASVVASENGQGDVPFLEQMKRICEMAQPKVRVRAECLPVESSKAETILLLGEKLGIDIMVIGQRRTLSSAILRSRRPGGSLRGSKGVDTAEYLIENSKCTCVGVQKKGQNGGYILNSKIHKNFWLLA